MGGGCAAARRDRARTAADASPSISPPPQQCLQYVTDQLADVKKVERLATALVAAAATGAPPPQEAEAPAAASPAAAPARKGRAKGKGGGARRG
jgi:hypothetical protein